MSSNRSGDRLTFLLIGAGIGASLALLFAPKPGKDLRRDIAEVSKRTYGKGSDAVRRVGDRVTQGMETVRGAVDHTKGQIQGAFDAGKQSFREERERSDT